MKFAYSFLFICVFIIGSVNAETKVASRLNLFKDAVEAVGAAGDAIINITDSIAHLVKTGKGGYDVIAASREYDRLLDLSAKSTNLVNLKQVVVVKSIEDYLALEDPTNHQWNSVKEGVQSVINGVKLLLTNVKEERSDFVLEEAYSRMGITLQSRALILKKISALPKPETKEELEQLKKLNKEYKRLITSFSEAIKQLNKYIKASKDA
jgi:hypothetical protein